MDVTLRRSSWCVPLALALLSSANAGAATGDPGAVPPQATRPADAHLPEGTSTDEGGLLGPVRLGALVGASIPRPVSVEGMLKVRDVVSLGFEYSVLPPVTVSGVRATLDAVDVDVRVFPVRSAFFLGVSGGRQHFDASGTVALPMGLGSVPEHVTADTWFVCPRLGLLWTWKSGVSVGMDAGAQIPVSSSFTSTAPTQLPGSQTVTDVSHLIGKTVLPNLTLLRLGYLF